MDFGKEMELDEWLRIAQPAIDGYISNQPYYTKLPTSMINKPGIYLLFNKDELVYVGQSEIPIMRVAIHVKEARKNFDSYAILECPASITSEVEAYIAAKYEPRENINLPQNEFIISYAGAAKEYFNNRRTDARKAIDKHGIEPMFVTRRWKAVYNRRDIEYAFWEWQDEKARI